MHTYTPTCILQQCTNTFRAFLCKIDENGKLKVMCSIHYVPKFEKYKTNYKLVYKNRNTEENDQKFQFTFNKQIARNLHYSRNKDIAEPFSNLDEFITECRQK